MAANAATGGMYNGDDEAETLALPDHESKVSYNLQKWKDRVRENGVAGNVRLVLDKEARVWARGDKGYYQYTHQVKEYTTIYELVVGRYAVYFCNFLLASNAAVLFLMLMSIAGFLVTRRRSGWWITLLIYWLGAVLFYVFWESHPRQSLSYLVLMSMTVLPVLHWLCDKMDVAFRKDCV